LASRRDPDRALRSAEIDGANSGRCFRYNHAAADHAVLFIAGMIRMIDASKGFDSSRHHARRARLGVGDINLYLYRRRLHLLRPRLRIGDRVIFSCPDHRAGGVLLYLRQRHVWTEIGGGA